MALTAVLAGSTTGGARLSAQGPRLVVGAGGAALRLQSSTRIGAGELNGIAPAAEGSLSVGRFALEGAYLEGTLHPGTGAVASQDVIDGTLLLSARPAAFVRLKGGVHARSYATPGGTTRWVLWEVRARGVAPLGGSAVNAYMEIWRVITSATAGPAPLDQGQGGEAGLEATAWRGHAWLRLSYAIDDLRSGGGTVRQTVETFLLTAGTRAPW